jgi:hypothetical protein
METRVDVERAKEIWADYCAHHDTSSLQGQTAAIEPLSGRIWFGESATDTWRQMTAEGVTAPALCLRVGKSYYLRKGVRR